MPAGTPAFNHLKMASVPELPQFRAVSTTHWVRPVNSVLWATVWKAQLAWKIPRAASHSTLTIIVAGADSVPDCKLASVWAFSTAKLTIAHWTIARVASTGSKHSLICVTPRRDVHRHPNSEAAWPAAQALGYQGSNVLATHWKSTDVLLLALMASACTVRKVLLIATAFAWRR